jgi:hypothetical protein
LNASDSAVALKPASVADCVSHVSGCGDTKLGGGVTAGADGDELPPPPPQAWRASAIIQAREANFFMCYP